MKKGDETHIPKKQPRGICKSKIDKTKFCYDFKD